MNNESPAAYVMVLLKAKSREEMIERYAQGAMATIAARGGEMIAGSPVPRVREGDWDGNWAAILRFPSLEDAEAWYDSTEYQPLKDLRINELEAETSHVVFIEG